jgi:hypothetical protein
MADEMRSYQIETHSAEFLVVVDETPDITLGEIAAHVYEGHELRVAWESREAA